jgi:hypothetical protein
MDMINRTPARDRALSRIAANPDEWLSNALSTVCGGDMAALQSLYDERSDKQIADEGFTDPSAYLAAPLPALGLSEIPMPEPAPVPAPPANAYGGVLAELTEAERSTLAVRLTATTGAGRALQIVRESALAGLSVSRSDILAAMLAATVITAERAAELA